MTHTYNISGMTCGGCVAKAKSELLKLSDVTEADLQLASPQATITMQKHIPTIELQKALNKAGNYTIAEADGGIQHMEKEVASSWLHTYKPVLIIGAYITGTTLLIEAVKGHFDWAKWMNNFMGAFFLSFSFFKLLDLKGFAESYSTYDIIAKRWMGYGYVYAFLELALGLAFITSFNPLLTNIVTLFVMSASIIGVLQALFTKRKIKCACLGAVFNLPMSTVTIIEDALMIVMSLFSVLTLLLHR